MVVIRPAEASNREAPLSSIIIVESLIIVSPIMLPADCANPIIDASDEVISMAPAGSALAAKCAYRPSNASPIAARSACGYSM